MRCILYIYGDFSSLRIPVFHDVSERRDFYEIAFREYDFFGGAYLTVLPLHTKEETVGDLPFMLYGSNGELVRQWQLHVLYLDCGCEVHLHTQGLRHTLHSMYSTYTREHSTSQIY